MSLTSTLARNKVPAVLGALGVAALCWVLWLCGLTAYAAIAVAQMLAPWLAIAVVALVVPLKGAGADRPPLTGPGTSG